MEMTQANHPSENTAKAARLGNVSAKTENAAKQGNVPAKAENAAKKGNVPAKNENAIKPHGKPVTVPEPARKQPGSNGASKQAASQKSAAAVSKVLPVQEKGNGYGLSRLEKAEKAVKSPGKEKHAAVRETEKGNHLTNREEAEQYVDFTMKNKSKSTRLVPKAIEPQGKSTGVSKPKKAERIEPQRQMPFEKGNAPAGKEEIPHVDQAINPIQRSNSSGGQSTDRVSTGLSTISLLEKWFEWNKYDELKLVQPYHSRYALMNTQWVNAPPSPPPQKAPFLKNVNRS